MSTAGIANFPKAASAIKTKKALEIYLCQSAMHWVDKKGRYVSENAPTRKRRVVTISACAECESPCAYGIRYLRLMTERELKEVTCGADCGECRQPCNLYIPVLEKRKAAMDRWLRIALREE